MRLLVLDFETYFDPDFSLRKLSTEEYVRDLRFKVHMLGYWLPDTMPAPATCTDAVLRTNEQFRELVRTSAVLCHHAHFDGLILGHHYGLRPAFWFDTLAMSHLVLHQLNSHSLESLAAHCSLQPKSVPYNLFSGVRDLPPDIYKMVAEGCEHDVALTYSIWRQLTPSVPAEEFKVIDSTIRMFTEPVLRLDRPRMEAFLQAERISKGQAMLAAGRALGIRMPTTVEEVRSVLYDIEAELQSSDKFRLALASLGFACPMKWSEKQKKDIPALAKNDEGMNELLEHSDPRVQALAAARLGVKSTIDETRAERLLATDARGAVPIYLKYAATKTIRWAGGDRSNPQNWRRGGEIRKSILAPDGHALVIGDLSQIEYRLLLWLTGQTDKLDALAAGRDLYCEFASDFYGRSITKENKPERGVGKQGTLMCGYGAGKGTMIATAAAGGYGPPVYLTEDDGQRMVDTYRNGHPCVTGFWRWCDALLPILASGGETSYKDVIHIRDCKIWLPNGTFIDYAGMRRASNVDIFPDQEDDGQGYSWWERTRKGWARTWGSKLTADIIQSLARVVIASALVKVAPKYKIALQVHDELIAVVPIGAAEEARALMETTLRTPPAWCSDIPLEAEVIVSERYDK